jgi:hypothetical protein
LLDARTGAGSPPGASAPDGRLDGSTAMPQLPQKRSSVARVALQLKQEDITLVETKATSLL